MSTITGVHTPQSIAQPGDEQRVLGQRQVEQDRDDLAGARGLALSVAISAVVFAALGWGLHLIIS